MKGVIKMVATFRNQGNERLFGHIGRKTGANPISHKALNKRRSFDEIFRRGLSDVIDELTESERAAITAYIETSFVSSDQPSLGRCIAEWLRPDEIENGEFAEKCTNEHGKFLLIRSPEPGRVRTSLMEVSFSPAKDVCPTYVTTRTRNNDRQVLRGQLFEHKGYHYAAGRYDTIDGIRFSKIQMYERPDLEDPDEMRYDLYGIRVGHSRDPNLPYAHLIYGYQLKSERDKAIIDKLMQAESADDQTLKIQIQNLDFIMKMLTPDSLRSNGLMIVEALNV